MEKGRRALPDAMAFYHEKGLVPAWREAMRFAGKGGRIATLPDIIEARLATDPSIDDSQGIGWESTPWNRYFTTLSSEFYGKSRGGNKIIIVAHGIGPMSKLDGILKAYSYEYKDKSRNHRGGRITQEEFWKLESGHYGSVHIIDAMAYVKRYQYAFIEHLDSNQLMNDPLAIARLGPKATQYIQAHAEWARKWHALRSQSDEENRYNLQSHADYQRRRHITHVNFSFPSSAPIILQLGAASNCFYLHYDDRPDVRDYVDYYERREGPFAHLLSIGGLVNMGLHGQAGESLVSDIHCHEWHDGTRLVGVCADGSFERIHPGFDAHWLLRKHWQELMEPAQGLPLTGIRMILPLSEDVWFTQVPSSGHVMQNHEPEFRITKMQKVDNPLDLMVKIEGYYGFLRYDAKEVAKIAPRGANAWVVVGEPTFPDQEHHLIKFQFYRVEADTTKRLMREDQLRKDYDLQMRLLEEDYQAH